MADRARRLQAGAVDHFDPEIGMDTAELWEFIGATQTSQPR